MKATRAQKAEVRQAGAEALVEVRVYDIHHAALGDARPHQPAATPEGKPHFLRLARVLRPDLVLLHIYDPQRDALRIHDLPRAHADLLNQATDLQLGRENSGELLRSLLKLRALPERLLRIGGIF